MKKQVHWRSDEGGSALSMVLILLMIVIIMGTAVLSASTSNYTFGIADHKQQSAHYIAEAGVRYAVNELTKDAKSLIGTSYMGNAALFFSTLEGKRIFQPGQEISNFTPQLGVAPVASISITPVPGESTALKRVYLVRSEGQIGSQKVTLATKAKVEYAIPELPGEFLKEVFIYAGALNLQSGVLDAPEGLLHVNGDIVVNTSGRNDIRADSLAKLKKLYVTGRLEIMSGDIQFGTTATDSWVVVKGDVKFGSNAIVRAPMYAYSNFEFKNTPQLSRAIYVNNNLTVDPYTNLGSNIKDYFYVKGSVTPSTLPTDINKNANSRIQPLASMPVIDHDAYRFNLKPASWSEWVYYVKDSAPALQSNKRYLFSGNVNKTDLGALENCIIVANGDVNIAIGDNPFHGVIIAKGKVTVQANKFTGVVISDGLVELKNTYNGVFMKKLVDPDPAKGFYPSADKVPVDFNLGGTGGSGSDVIIDNGPIK